MKNRTLAAAFLAAAALGACADEVKTPVHAGAARTADASAPAPRVAVVQHLDGRPVLFFQDVDGTDRRRVRFTHVRDLVEGNNDLVRLSDATIGGLGPMRWSPDGSRLAVVVSVGFDNSFVVVVDATGRNARVVSNNWQTIQSNLDWSPDGRHVVYAMSTVGSDLVDVFASDVETGAWTRLTTGEDLRLPSVRFSADGTRVLYSRHAGFASDGTGNPAYALRSVAVAGGEPATVAEGLVGDVDGISRTGTWALLNRLVAADGGVTRALVRRDVATGRESVVVPGAVRWGQVLNLESLVLVAGGREMRVVSLDGTDGPVLVGTTPESGAADVWFAPVR